MSSIRSYVGKNYRSFLLNAGLFAVVFFGLLAFQTRNMLSTDGLPAPELRGLLLSARNKLLEARAARVRPGCDEKVLSSWNALAIAGLARAAAATYAPRGLRVNAVAPGLVDTPLAERIVGNERAVDVYLPPGYEQGTEGDPPYANAGYDEQAAGYEQADRKSVV